MKLVVLVPVLIALATTLVALSPAPASAQEVVCDDDGCYRVVGGPTGDLCTAAEYALSGSQCIQQNPFTTPTEQATFQCAGAPAGVAVTPVFATVDNITFITSCTYPVPGGTGECPDDSKRIEGECREPVGRVKLSYTVDCVGEGIARVELGTPEITDNAGISLITVNGSAVVGADIAGGSAVAVAITPSNTGDIVEISGPGTAPPCSTTTPTVVATAVPTATTAPAPPAAPSATPVPAEQPTATPTATTAPAETDDETSDDAATDDDSDATEDAPAEDEPVEAEPVDAGPVAIGAIDSVTIGECDAIGNLPVQFVGSLNPVDIADQVQWSLDGVALGEPVVPGLYTAVIPGDGAPHFVTMRSITRTSVAEAGQEILLPECIVAAPTPVPVATVAVPVLVDDVDDSATDDGSGFPVVPVVLIGGAGLAIAAGAYLGLIRKQ